MSDHYIMIQARVDQQFNVLQKRYKRDFACREGCHQCCSPDLSVSLVEAQRNLIDMEKIEKLKKLEVKKKKAVLQKKE